ncbi:MAG TPA: ATP-binding protein [Polyangia bacterium]|nr:ATP-binding protein [Polyangia bacterium]
MPDGPPANPTQFTAFFHSMPDGAAVFEVGRGGSAAPEDYLCADANPSFWRLLGRSPSQPPGRRLADFSFARVHLARLRAVLTEGEPTGFDAYADEIGKSFRVSAFQAGEGRLAIVLRDTTAERHAEAERLRFLRQTSAGDAVVDGEGGRLQELEALFRNTVENIPINVILYDRDYRILYINPSLVAMCASFGIDTSTIIGRRGSEVWGPHIWNPLHARCQRAVETGELQDYELESRIPGDRKVVRHWTVVPVRRADGDFRVIVMTHDLTVQRRMVEELQEADRRKSEFIAVLSHELRNPLAAMRASLYVLEHGAAAGDAALHAREAIDRQVEHLARMVDDLLDVTRIERDKISLQRKTLDLRALVRETVDDHRTHLEQTGVRIEMNLVDGPVYVNADPARIAQVAANLVSNAAKFTPSGGKATVSVSVEGESRAVLRVVDTGIGIDPALLPKLFVPFMQADRTLDRAGGGLGLGLALVKGLVELHGGDVEARSAGAGKGTEIVVRLPLERVTAPVAIAEAPSPGGETKRRVLVIEDDPDVGEALRVALVLDHHDVVVARTGGEGIESARRSRPDVVLCDIGLPGLNGYDVARAFRADPALAPVFLVALSGYAQASDVARAKDAGFDYHLAKPTSIPKIQKAIAAATTSAAVRTG